MSKWGTALLYCNSFTSPFLAENSWLEWLQDTPVLSSLATFLWDQFMTFLDGFIWPGGRRSPWTGLIFKLWTALVNVCFARGSVIVGRTKLDDYFVRHVPNEKRGFQGNTRCLHFSHLKNRRIGEKHSKAKTRYTAVPLQPITRLIPEGFIKQLLVSGRRGRREVQRSSPTENIFC